jgi:hypothetical protein
MKTKLTGRLLLAIACSLLLYSCQKESSTDQTAVTSEEAKMYADESAQADAAFDDVEDISMIAAEEEAIASEGGRGTIIFPFAELRLRLGPCADITVTPNDSTYPKTITIDFGEGCVCADGKFRKGKIVIHLTGPIRRPGSVMTITFVNFYLNRAHIEGTKIISNLSSNGDIKFTVQVVGGKVTFPSGRGYQYNSLKYVKQVAGGNTRSIRDDVYTIQGGSNTQFNNGLTIHLETDTPLVKKVVCHWISDGKLRIRINTHRFLLDYGAPDNGVCDNKALLSWNGGQVLIVLP